MVPMVMEGAVMLSLPSEASFSSHVAIGTSPSDSVKACGPIQYLLLKPDEAPKSSKLAHEAEGFCIVLQYITDSVLCQCVGWPSSLISKLYKLLCIKVKVRQMYFGNMLSVCYQLIVLV